MVTPGDTAAGVVVDFLFASSGIETEVVRAADELDIMPGLRVPVATLAHLIALKVLSRDDRTRPQDRVDLVALLTRADSTAIATARAALAMIAERGFSRGHDLLAAFGALLSEQGRGGGYESREIR